MWQWAQCCVVQRFSALQCTLAAGWPCAGQPELAWQLYLQQQALGGGVAELLALLANDCYRAAAWLWAARAFDALEFLQQQGGGGGAVAGAEGAAAWEGKRGACVAVFQAVTAGEMEAEVLRYAGCATNLGGGGLVVGLGCFRLCAAASSKHAELPQPQAVALLQGGAHPAAQLQQPPGRVHHPLGQEVGA